MNYLTDDRGNASSMRLMCLLSLLASVAFGVLTIKTGSDNGLIITLAFLGGTFAPKAVQKVIENKLDLKVTDTPK